ncbi:MAG: ECF transporter S component [Ruminococcaceae bacterium]|nr:ECF transporter S component [Oscillospiraceae bacterium]
MSIKSNNTKRRRALYNLVKIAILSALSSVIMLLEFPIPFLAPGFYKLDFSEVIILIGGFSMGPTAALIMEFIKNLINLLIDGSVTGGVGELANFLIGASFTVSASIVYKFIKTKKGALISCLVGCVSLALVGACINYFIVVPAYASMFGGIDNIIMTGAQVNPAVNSLFKFVLICVIPFNLVKGVLCSVISFLLYKKVSPILHL